MITPTVHLNGTSREALQEQYREAYSKLGETLVALIAAGPNGRDYYPQGSDVLLIAQREHRERIAKVRSVQDDMLALFESVDAPPRPQDDNAVLHTGGIRKPVERVNGGVI